MDHFGGEFLLGKARWVDWFLRDFGVSLDARQEQVLVNSPHFAQTFNGAFLRCFAPCILGCGAVAA
jgi:hypothetical protein